MRNNDTHILTIATRINNINASTLLIAYLCSYVPSAYADIVAPSSFMEEYCATIKLNSLELKYNPGNINAFSSIGAKEGRTLSSGENARAFLKGLNQDMEVENELIEIYTKKFKEIGITINKYGLPRSGRGGLTIGVTTSYIGPAFNDSNDYNINQKLTIFEHATTDYGRPVWSELLYISAGDLSTKRWVANTIYNQADQIVSEYSKLRLKAIAQCK